MGQSQPLIFLYSNKIFKIAFTEDSSCLSIHYQLRYGKNHPYIYIYMHFSTVYISINYFKFLNGKSILCKKRDKDKDKQTAEVSFQLHSRFHCDLMTVTSCSLSLCHHTPLSRGSHTLLPIYKYAFASTKSLEIFYKTYFSFFKDGDYLQGMKEPHAGH